MNPTPPPPAKPLAKATLEQIKAEAAANLSTVGHHRDHAAWVSAWRADADDNARHRAHHQRHLDTIERHAVRNVSLNAAMNWLSYSNRIGFRPRPEEEAADVAELLQVAEQFEAWITAGDES